MTEGERIGLRVRRWRERRGLSQRKAAAAAGMNQSEWMKLELGKFRRMTLLTAYRVVRVTGGAITYDDLFAAAANA